MQFLADKVEGNLIAAYQELKKLALLYPAGALSFDQVKDAVLDVARYDVFKLSDAMMAGETARYTRMLEGLQGEGTALPLIVNTLAGQIRSLITIRKGLDSGRPAHAIDESDQSLGRSTESNGKRCQAPQISNSWYRP